MVLVWDAVAVTEGVTDTVSALVIFIDDVVVGETVDVVVNDRLGVTLTVAVCAALDVPVGVTVGVAVKTGVNVGVCTRVGVWV